VKPNIRGGFVGLRWRYPNLRQNKVFESFVSQPGTVEPEGRAQLRVVAFGAEKQ